VSKKSADNGVRRFTLKTGEWIEMRPMTIDDLEAFSEATERPGPAIRAVKAACVASKFKNGLSLGEQPITVLTDVLAAWNVREDEEALPPAAAPPSEPPS
jgi:hypothetical protein